MVLNVSPLAGDRDVGVLHVGLLDDIHKLFALLPSLFLGLLLVLVHKVLEELVALLLIDEFEEFPLHQVLRCVLIPRGDLQVRPLVQRLYELILGALSLLSLLLLLPLLRLRDPDGELLLSLAGRVQREEAPVLLAQLRRLLPLHVRLDTLVLQHVPEGCAPLLRSLPLRLLLLLLLLLVLALLLIGHAPQPLQLDGHLPDALLRHGVVEVVAAVRRLVLLPTRRVHLLLLRLEAIGLVPCGLLRLLVVVVPAAIGVGVLRPRLWVGGRVHHPR
mmetsp:Transcript_116946/g.327238  ORF Transcript_116946/g.327238 Transcript_116946/m.327238 type:complete len:274 (+) Transcript_116946:1147-1968(+)